MVSRNFSLNSGNGNYIFYSHLAFITNKCFFFLFLFQACAPRYVYYVFMGRMDPVGMCFSARKNFSQIRAHRPCVESGRSFFTRTNFSNFFFFFSLPHHPNQFLKIVTFNFYYIYTSSLYDVSVRLSHICLFAKFANFHPTQKIVNKQQKNL